jgi:hypothetical protein
LPLHPSAIQLLPSPQRTLKPTGPYFCGFLCLGHFTDRPCSGKASSMSPSDIMPLLCGHRFEIACTSERCLYVTRHSCVPSRSAHGTRPCAGRADRGPTRSNPGGASMAGAVFVDRLESPHAWRQRDSMDPARINPTLCGNRCGRSCARPDATDRSACIRVGAAPIGSTPAVESADKKPRDLNLTVDLNGLSHRIV